MIFRQARPASQPMTTRPMSRSHGFTLIELITTMLIISMVAVFAVGRLNFSDEFDQRATRDKLLAGLQYARKAAVAQRRIVCVATTGNKTSFTFDIRKPEDAVAPYCTAGNQGTLALPTADKECGGTTHQVCAHAGVTLTGSDFSFDASGGTASTATFSVSGASTFTCGDGSSTGAICVEASTGYVHGS